MADAEEDYYGTYGKNADEEEGVIKETLGRRSLWGKGTRGLSQGIGGGERVREDVWRMVGTDNY